MRPARWTRHMKSARISAGGQVILERPGCIDAFNDAERQGQIIKVPWMWYERLVNALARALIRSRSTCFSSTGKETVSLCVAKPWIGETLGISRWRKWSALRGASNALALFRLKTSAKIAHDRRLPAPRVPAAHTPECQRQSFLQT